MSTPTRGVLTIAQAARFGPIEDRLRSASDTAGGLRLLGPDRLEYPHNQVGGDLGHRHITEDRIGIGGKRAPPLQPVLGVTPPEFARGDELLSALLESSAFGRPCSGS